MSQRTSQVSLDVNRLPSAGNTPIERTTQMPRSFPEVRAWRFDDKVDSRKPLSAQVGVDRVEETERGSNSEPSFFNDMLNTDFESLAIPGGPNIPENNQGSESPDFGLDFGDPETEDTKKRRGAMMIAALAVGAGILWMVR